MSRRLFSGLHKTPQWNEWHCQCPKVDLISLQAWPSCWGDQLTIIWGRQEVTCCTGSDLLSSCLLVIGCCPDWTLQYWPAELPPPDIHFHWSLTADLLEGIKLCVCRLEDSSNVTCTLFTVTLMSCHFPSLKQVTKHIPAKELGTSN